MLFSLALIFLVIIITNFPFWLIAPSQRMWALKTLRKIVTTDIGSGLNIKALLSASYSSSSTPAPSRPISPVPQATISQSLPAPQSLVPPTPQSLAPPAPQSLRGSTESLESSSSLVKPQIEVKQAPEMPLVSLLKGLPEALLRQAEYEDPLVRGGKHLMHSQFFKVSLTLLFFRVCFCIILFYHILIYCIFHILHFCPFSHKGTGWLSL